MSSWPAVYVDRQVRVLENPDALPRAWVVHDARRVAPGTALDLVVDGRVDPRTTALLTTAPPRLDGDARGAATVVDRGTDRLEVEVTTTGAGLLVVSEVFDPMWRATVDGRPADVVVVDDVLRGVAVPAGRHTVELTADTTVLHAGLAVTGVTIVALAVAAWWAVRRRGRTS
jgi:hypothetical protein